jgi:hypothetical protein
MTAIIHVIAAAAILLIVWSIVYEFIPWSSKLVVLYGLHDLRDRLYMIGNSAPSLRDTLIYRDSEFMLCVAINVVRMRDYRAAIGLASGFAVAKEPPSHATSWRRNQYAVEMTAANDSPERLAAFTEMMDLGLRSRNLVLFRGVFGHPLATIIAILSIGAMAINAFTRMIVTAPTDILVNAVSTIESGPTQDGSALDVRRILVS